MLPLLLFSAFLLQADDRQKATDWPANTTLTKATLGAEYMVHSVISGEDYILLKDYLAVDVGIYPNAKESPLISQQHFMLRINGKKAAVFPQTAGMAAASLKYEEWEQGRATGGFPGDPRPRQGRLPENPRVPEQDNSGVEKEAKRKPEDVVVAATLPEGETAKPLHGYLYFAFKGKPGSIKKLELLYSGPAGSGTIDLK